MNPSESVDNRRQHREIVSDSTRRQREIGLISPLVLIVDDDADLRDLYAQILAGAGFRVDEASDGLEGVERALVVRPRVVLLDLHLPVFDGWETARRLKAAHRLRRIPIVAVTADSSHRSVVAAVEAGFDAFLSKPATSELLLAVLAKVMTPPGAGAAALRRRH
jgi:CheY-like chemotaxis protein